MDSIYQPVPARPTNSVEGLRDLLTVMEVHLEVVAPRAAKLDRQLEWELSQALAREEQWTRDRELLCLSCMMPRRECRHRRGNGDSNQA